MEQQNTSSHPLLPPGFGNAPFASTFTGITPAAGSVNNPLLASTLHHLQELSAAGGAAGLLPNSSQLTLGSQFATELNNFAAVGWPSAQNANAAWLEQAKVAAILPMYTVFSAGSLKPSDAATFDPGDKQITIQADGATNSAVISSPVVPFNAGTVSSKTESNVQKGSSQPSTPQQRSQHAPVGSAQSSPASALLVTDRQPSSIQSHCSTDVRPCSTSSLGPSSVPNHSSVGSADHLPGSVGVAAVSDGSIVRPGSQQSSSSYSMLRVNDSISAHSPAQVAAASVPPMSGIQQRALDVTTASQLTELRSSSSGLHGVTSAGTSEVIQTSASSNRHTSNSPRENVVDTNHLEDLPWSSIDLGDIDLFGGSSVVEKDVMHSVFDEMDPSVMHRLFMNEPSTSAIVTLDASKTAKLPPIMSASQILTPKIREKIKMRREKELADADKELDRLLSLVAKKDATSTPASKIPKLLPAFDPVIVTKPESSDDHKISLSPVQFTPPDSPTPSTSTDASLSTCNFFFPASTSSSNVSTRPTASRSSASSGKAHYVFMSSTEKKNKSNKVPVYKQKAKTFFHSMLRTEENVADDAYSFTDDEEDNKPLPSGATASETRLREQKLEAEVAQKLARINNAHSELKSKVGGSEPQLQQDLWRHVVPKKRHSVAAERPSVPSTPLLPPASVGQKVAEPQTITTLLLRRNQHRSSFGFLKTKCLDDQDTAKNEQRMEPSVTTVKTGPKEDGNSGSGMQSEQPLPKLLIRLPRRSVDENALAYERPKKKKKRKRRESDQEWVGSESKRKKKKKKRKHKHHHHKKRDASECQRENASKQDEQWNTSENTGKEAAVFSKKRRLIMHWNEAEENLADSEYYREQSNPRNFLASFEDSDGHSLHPESSEHSILSKFHPADGHLTKGTFVVCKADILKEDCPLWRVDNQNLLQKYPPFILDGKIAYRNSSTYSGWCDQIADSYIVVRVRFIKHSRSESIIEPELSLLDMFPAISTEYEERPSVNSEVAAEQEADLFMGDLIRKQMSVYVKAMLNHALDMTFLQATKQKNDWDYLCALNDIDKLNQERKEKVQSQVNWIQRYWDLLHFYSSCVICDSEGGSLSCQACGTSGVEKVVQLFCNEGYDYDTLEAEEVRYTGSGSPLHAVEYLVCSSCAKLSGVYHKLHHMRYMLLRNCEDKLEKVSTGNAGLTPDAIVETCMNDVKWLCNIVNEYADLWGRIEMNNC